MLIKVIGIQDNLDECAAKFGPGHQYLLETKQSANKTPVAFCDIVFDFSPRSSMVPTPSHPREVIFLNTSFETLHERHNDIETVGNLIFGFCGLPGFLNRELVELSVRNPGDAGNLQTVCERLGTSFRIVADEVGLVTPRVICMIINEAYFAVEDKIATRQDIDLAMKSGTNYPYGPFEWCARIGAGNIVDLLRALEQQSNDGRYKICPLLLKEL